MYKKISIDKLKPKTVDALRDLAVKIEKNDLETAQELMLLAYTARPTGTFIKAKLDEYIKKSALSQEDEIKLKQMVESGEIAIIPIGFRCFAKQAIQKLFGVVQESLVFDSGFFPPSSVASVLRNPTIRLKYSSDYNDSHAVCIKYENYNDPISGKGIKFQKSTYHEINSLSTGKEIDNINMYLDSTFGYYTLDLKHNFVLAHYNWHSFADINKSKGIADPAINIKNINDILNRRVQRMFDKCNSAKYIFFIFFENQSYNYMMIDNEKFDLNDLSEIKNTVNNIFGSKAFVLKMNESCSVNDIFKVINSL